MAMNPLKDASPSNRPLPSGGTAGQVLAKIDETHGNVEWVDQTGGGGAGSGDVVGPSSVTADRIVVFNGTTGKLVKQASQTIADILALIAAKASPADVAAAVAALVASAPGTLDTLDEIAAALGDDPNFATTLTTLIGTKAAAVHVHAGSDITTGTIPDARIATMTDKNGWRLVAGETDGDDKTGVWIPLDKAGAFVGVYLDTDAAIAGADYEIDLKLQATPGGAKTTIWSTVGNRAKLTNGQSQAAFTVFNTTTFAAGSRLWLSKISGTSTSWVTVLLRYTQDR